MKLAGVDFGKDWIFYLATSWGSAPSALRVLAGNYAVNAIVTEGLNRDRIEPRQPIGEGAAAPESWGKTKPVTICPQRSEILNVLGVK